MSKVKNSTVLIVNDAPDTLELMRLQLLQAGYQVLTAADGREGFEVARLQRPDMVVSDVAMPEVNGIELCRMIRAEAGLHTIPILLVSALRKETASVVAGLEAGADDYLEVPYDPLHLIAKVARLLERRQAEGQLQFQAHLLNTVEQAVIATDLEGKISYWNRFAERLYGWSAAEAIGGNVIDLISAQTTLGQPSEIMSRLRDGRSWSGEFYVRRKDGTIFPAIVTDSPIYDDKGALVGIVGVSADISERKRAEAALKESEAELKEVQRLAGLGSWHFEIKSGAVRWSEELFIIYGRDPSHGALSYSEHAKILTPESLVVLEAALSKTIEQNVPWEIELEILRPDQSRRWILSRGEPVRDAAGSIIVLRGTALDITECKRAEETLRESEERYRTLFNSIDEGFCIIEVLFDGNDKPIDYRFLDVNPSFEKQTGIKGARGRRMREIAPQHEEYWFEIYGKIALTGEPARFENLAAQLHRWYDVYAFPVGEPQERKVAILFHDITERKRAEELLRRANDELERRVEQRTYELTTANTLLEEKIAECARVEQILRENHNLLQGVIEGTTDYIFVKDLNGRYLMVNSAAANFIGKPAEEIIGKDDTELFPPEIAQQLIENDRQVIASDEMLTLEETLLYKGISQTALVIRNVYRNDEGKAIGLIGISRDITERKRTEEKIKESERQLAVAQQIAHLGSWEWDIPTNKVSWSDELYRISGLTPQQFGVSYESYLELVHLDDRKFVNEIIEKALCAPKPFDFEHRIVRQDGEVRTLRCQGEVGTDESGHAVKMYGIAQDITERKRVEEALKQSEQDYRGLFEQAHDAILVFAPEREIVLDVNERACEIYGFSRSEFIGMSLETISKDVARGKARIAETLDRGDYLNFETEQYRKDGTEILLEINASTVLYRGQRAVLSINRDITERKRAQEELKVSEESYRRLVELSTDTILVVSDGKIDYINPTGVKLFGATSPEQLVGLPFLRLVHPDFHGLVKERVRQTLEGKKTRLLEQKHVRLDGKIINTEVTGIGITYRGKPATQAIIRDITERVRAREARIQLQLRLLAAQEEERRRLSRELHDQMGQHLPALMLGLKALKDAGHPTVERLQQLQDLAERIARDTHTLARDLRPAALDDFGLLTVLSNYLEEWSRRYGIPADFQSAGFKNEERFSTHVEITLYRTVQEALTNVVKHAEAERVSLILERGPESVLAVVEDDGKGFDVGDVMSTPAGERRLGLLGMQERVELVSGTLEIESAPGAGTTVAIRIPTITS